jgi:hypothetical protein
MSTVLFAGVRMIDRKALQRAIVVGTLLQITLAVLGYYSSWIMVHTFLFGGMMISATSGFLYAQDVGPGWARGVLAGAIAGGVCGFVGIALSVALRDTPAAFLWLGTAIAVLTGAVGGLWGQVSFNMKSRGW